MKMILRSQYTLVSTIILLTISQFAYADDRPPPAREPTQRNVETDIRSINNIEPSVQLTNKINQFLLNDPSASFNFYRGHVDSFSARPKKTIPDYALPVLIKYDLSTSVNDIYQLGVAEKPKSGKNLDANLTRKMPVHYELSKGNANFEPNQDDEADAYTGVDAKHYKRTKRNPLQLPALWQRPDQNVLGREEIAAREILIAFLRRHRSVFELNQRALDNNLPDLISTGYTVGKYARKARFEQTIDGEPLIGGKLLALFDHNWNVITISRMIADAQKLSLADDKPGVSRNEAIATAIAALAKQTDTRADIWAADNATVGVDPIRRHRIWLINASSRHAIDLNSRVKVHAQTGDVLNVSDNIDRFGDAKVRRWGYSSGNLEAPSQYVAEDFYTRDDNSLVHDFFHIVTDGRGGGDVEVNCADTNPDSLWREQAYDTTTGSSYVRPTLRGDRDFSLWYPYSVAGSFSETNSYFWARWFFQWIKGSIGDLGELPASSSDYQQVLIVANACISAGGLYKNGGEVTTLNDEGEGNPVIYLPEKCKSGNPNCTVNDYTGFGTFKTCEGNGCSSPPSVIHHEINHFLLKQYYEVFSGIDCSIDEELKYLHEGILGSVVPQAYWNHYYNVGYNPADNFLYKADYDAGLIHSDNNTLRTVSDYPCSDSGDPYKSGRVAGQVMWEILHGKHVDGNTISSMPRPATDRDFLVLTYWAAELVDASSYKDRYEMANKVMEIMELHSNLSSTGKGKWCEAWEHHELDTWINNSYCS